MLRCPKCNRTYQDDMQKFCTHDGGRLVPDIEKPKSFDPNATVTTDGSGLEIPPSPYPISDLGATIAAPPPKATPASTPSTSGFRSSDTSPTPFSDTSRLGQTSQDEVTQYPSISTPPPQAPPPPAPPPSTPVQSADSAGSSRDLPAASTPLPAPSAPLAPQDAPAIAHSAPLPVGKKKSKTGLLVVIGGALLVLLLVGGAVGAYFLFFKERTPRRGREVTVTPVPGSNTPSYNNPEPPIDNTPKPVVAPPNSLKFENSASTLDGKLAAHYVDFYFYYPQTWHKNPKAGVAGAANFVEVERQLPPDYTQENLTVSWYESKGTVEADLKAKLPTLIKERNASLSKSLPEYQKVSEGKTTVNGIEGYELRFKAVSRGTDKGDIFIWGRVVYLPPGDETSIKGVTLYMLTTSLAPELESIDDIGVKGELPIILNSFTLGKG